MSSKTTTAGLSANELQTDKIVVFDANAPVYCEQGICSTCRHHQSCLYLKSARRPVAFCEEFDCSGTNRNGEIKTQAAAKRQPINYGEAQAIGICAACESKTSCIYRQHGSAVWDCQDYS